MSTTPTFSHDGIAYGCDYNPEQWDRSVWREDVALMQEAGVDLVALNIFGWSHLEPRPGEFDFAGLDEILDLLHEAGIRVNLGTGTASAPPWLTFRHPEILPETEDGTTRFPGGRQAWCPSSAVFRRYALELVEGVAERYGAHPAVELWHVSNELGCHNALCYDDESAEAFRGWLRARYETIERLNTAWGTSFWSQQYSDFAEILPPRLTLSSRNPSQVIDFHRFSSDELLGYYRAELEVLRRHSSVPVTTNFMVTAHIRNLDYWQWAPEMDVVANDHYLDNRLADPTAELAFASDLTRGLAGGGAWLLMEQSTGAVNWQPQNLAKAPGEMTRNSLTHVAKGAEAICFFQWRASLQGSEKFHSALLPHAGTDSDVWREVVELGATLDRLDEITGTRVQADVALLFSWENWWAADGESRPTHASTTSRRSTRSTRRCVVWATPSTSCVLEPTSPPTGSSWSRTCTWCATARPRSSRTSSRPAGTPSSRSSAGSPTRRTGSAPAGTPVRSANCSASTSRSSPPSSPARC
jgi:beta-galactosidase